jgi:hypothetical protein
MIELLIFCQCIEDVFNCIFILTLTHSLCSKEYTEQKTVQGEYLLSKGNDIGQPRVGFVPFIDDAEYLSDGKNIYVVFVSFSHVSYFKHHILYVCYISYCSLDYTNMFKVTNCITHLK